MLRILLHSMACLLGIGFFTHIITNEGTTLSVNRQLTASPADEFKFFCEDFDAYPLGEAIPDVSGRWQPYFIDSLNARLVEGMEDENLKLAVDSGRVAILDMAQVSLLMDNQFHLEWMMDFQKNGSNYDTIYFSESQTDFSQAVSIAFRQDSLKFYSGQSLITAHPWGPNAGDNHFEVFFNTRIDSAFFFVNGQPLAIAEYDFGQIGYVVFKSNDNNYWLDDVCHSVQVDPEDCSCGFPDWTVEYCNAFESYFMGPFLANNAPDWKAFNGVDHSGRILQTDGKNELLLRNQDSIGLLLMSNLPQKSVFSFEAELEASVDVAAGGVFRMFIGKNQNVELLKLRYRKNLSKIESVELTINALQLPSYNVQEFKVDNVSEFSFLIDTSSWNINFFHNGILAHAWAIPDDVVNNLSNHQLTGIFIGRSGESYRVDNICIQRPPTINSCQLSPAWEAIFCDNFDEHDLGKIDMKSKKWSVQNTIGKAEIFVPDQLEDYDPQLRLPAGSRAQLSFSLNQLNTNRFRVNTFARLSNPLDNFGGNIFVKNDSTELIEIRMNDGFLDRSGIVFIYGDTVKRTNIPLIPSKVEEYDLSFLFDQDRERVEVFFNNTFLLSSDASDSLLIRKFLMQDMTMEYIAKQQPMIIEELAVFRRLANNEECSSLIAAGDTCLVAIGDSLYTPGEACLLGYLEQEWETFETPVVSGLKENVIMQIEELGGRVEGEKIFIDQGKVQELFFLLDKNSLALANAPCADYASIKFAYRGDPVNTESCTGEDFAWDFFNSVGGVVNTYVMDLVIETCIQINAVVGVDTFSVGEGMTKSGAFGLVVNSNEDLDFGFDEMDALVNKLAFDIDFESCNDNTAEQYYFGERSRLPAMMGNDSCFQYVVKIELYDEVCGFVVPAEDSVVVTILDTIAPTYPPLDTMHFACLDDAFMAAHASTIDTSLVTDNIRGNEDTSGITSKVYLSNNPFFEEVTKEWVLPDSCGNRRKIFQRFIVSEEPISLMPLDTAFVNQLSLVYNTDITGVLTGISSQCGAVFAPTYKDNKEEITACRDTVIRTWTIEDEAGNQRKYDQLIVYSDNQAPVIEPLPKVTFNRLSDTTNFAIVGIPRLISDDHMLIDTSFVDVISDSSRCYARINRTWMLTDACGNMASTEQELIFDARMDPDIVGLDTSVEAELEGIGATIINAHQISISQADVAQLFDILDENSLTLSNADCSNHVRIDFAYEGTVMPGDTSCSASDFVWRYIDENEKVTASFALSVNIVSCIEFIAAGNLIPASVPNGFSMIDQKTLSAQYVEGQPFSFEKMDSLVAALEYEIDYTSCNDNAAIRYTSIMRERLTGGPEQPCFRYSFQAEVYDEHCGFLEAMPISITVVDTIAPTYPPNDTLHFPCIGDAYLAAIPKKLNPVLIRDNILGNEDLTAITDTIYENGLFEFAAITKRWRIADQCGNARYVYQHFLVNQEPINLELPDTTLIARFSHLQDTSYTGTISNVFSHCGKVDNISYEDDITTLGGCEQTITRTWTVTDNRGNKRVAEQIFIYRDTLAPELNPFSIKRLSCVEDAADLTKSGLPTLKFDDHPVLNFTYKDEVFDSISCLKQIIRHWEVGDPCGNVTLIDQTIEIDNRNIPNITWPKSFVRVNCRPEIDDLSLTGSPAFPGVTCMGTTMDYDDELISATPCEVLYQRTWTVETECGLMVSNNQIIQVKDTIPPTFIAPQPVIIGIADLAKLSVTGFPTNIDDNCYVSNSIEFKDDWIRQPTCTETGLVSRKLTVLDQCHNAHTVEQMITILPLAATPINVSLTADTIIVPMDTTIIELPPGVPDTGIYSGPFVFENTFNVQEAGPGTFTVYYSIGDLESGCAFSDSVTVIVEMPNATVDHEFLSAVSIWPNPTSGRVTVRFAGIRQDPLYIKLWTGRGELIQNEYIIRPASNWDYELSMEELPAGLYWISFEGPDGLRGHRKIVKY
ncbi:MAG: hypothetical protein R2824_06930 [Saprospiraceae bacterium]|nr:hypothetical protein [Lewinella sp.]